MTTAHTPTPRLESIGCDVFDNVLGNKLCTAASFANAADIAWQLNNRTELAARVGELIAKVDDARIIKLNKSNDALVAALDSLMRPQVFGTYADDHARFQAVYPAEVWEAARAALAAAKGQA